MVAKAWEGVGSVLNCLLQDIVEKTFAGVGVRSPFRTERRSLLHLSHGGKKRAIQLSCAGSLHLGFDNEHVALFPDGALGRQLLKSVSNRPGIRAVDALSLSFIWVGPFQLRRSPQRPSRGRVFTPSSRRIRLQRPLPLPLPLPLPRRPLLPRL